MITAWKNRHKKPTSFAGLLTHNTVAMAIGFGVASFFTFGAASILVVSFLVGIYFAYKAVARSFLSGFLPPLFASLILQLIYFFSMAEMYTAGLIVVSLLLNSIPVAILAAVGAGIGKWLSSKKKASQEQKILKEEKTKSDFAESLKRLSIIVLFMYVSMHIVVPLGAKVYAAEASSKQSVDQFIENFDEEKKYQVAPEAVVEVNTGTQEIGSKPGNESEQLPTWKEQQAKEAAQQKAAKQKKQEEKINTLKKKNLSYKELEKLRAQKKITSTEMAQLVNAGAAKGTISWWDTAKFYAGIGKDAVSKVYETVAKPVGKALDWAKKHPLQAVGIAVGAVAVVAAAIFIAPVAAVIGTALTIVGVIGAVATAFTLVNGYRNGGWEGVKNALFSAETLQLWNAGDLGGAIGRGAVDVFNTVDSLLAIGAGIKVARSLPRLPGMITSGLVKAEGFIDGIKNGVKLRVAIAGLDGFVSGTGNKIVQSVVRLSTGNGSTARALAFLNAVPESKGLQKQIVGMADDVAIAKSVKGVSKDAVIAQKAKELAKKIEEEEEEIERSVRDTVGQHTKVPKATLKDVVKSNASYNIKTDTSNFAQNKLQHLFDGNINNSNKPVGFHYESPNSAGKVVGPRIPHPLAATNPAYKGIYQAEIEIWGYGKAANRGKSTFFPRNWSKEDVVDAINEAYKNPKLKQGNFIRGETTKGLQLDIFVDANGKIESAYPFWPKP